MVMKHLYIFSDRGAYGEFVKVCIASTLEEAQSIADLKRLGWNLIPDSIIQVNNTEESRLVFNGGGDNE